MNKATKESIKRISILSIVFIMGSLFGSFMETWLQPKVAIKVSQRAVNECWGYCSMNGLQGTNFMSVNKNYVFCSCANDYKKKIQNYDLE